MITEAPVNCIARNEDRATMTSANPETEAARASGSARAAAAAQSSPMIAPLSANERPGIQGSSSGVSADPATSADAVCIVPPTLLPRLALHDEKAHSEVRTEGDAALLTEIFFLSRNLRWDAAEDLSRVTGDIAAERIVQTAQGLHRNLRDTALNLSHAAAEYWTEEHPLIAKPRDIADFAQQVDKLRDDIARLEQRIRNLTNR